MPESLQNILGTQNENLGSALEICKLMALWPQVVDERVGKHTEPIKISNKIMYVSTSSAAWAQELSYLKKEIVEKFNQKAGKPVLYDIRFAAK